MTTTVNDGAPTCPCCGGSGMHAFTPSHTMNDPRADTEGCTTCSERGRSWHRSRPDGCTGFTALMARRRMLW